MNNYYKSIIQAHSQSILNLTIQNLNQNNIRLNEKISLLPMHVIHFHSILFSSQFLTLYKQFIQLINIQNKSNNKFPFNKFIEILIFN